MACSSLERSNVLIELFNLLSLPDERRTMTMTNNLPHNGTPRSVKSSTNGYLEGKHLMVMKVLESKYLIWSVRTALGTMLLTKSLVILVQSMKTDSNQQISWSLWPM